MIIPHLESFVRHWLFRWVTRGGLVPAAINTTKREHIFVGFDDFHTIPNFQVGQRATGGLLKHTLMGGLSKKYWSPLFDVTERD
jgi:hypothetical protein